MSPSAHRFIYLLAAALVLPRRLKRAFMVALNGAMFAATLFGGSIAFAAIPAAERAVLVSLYNGTAGANWTNTTAATNPWTVGGAPGNECSWYGIVCAVTMTGHTVTQINLQSNNLVGALPAALNTLTSLQYFRAQQNALSGALPSLTGLSALEYFDVRSNQLTGNLPTLAGLSALRVFSFENNQIVESIPPLASLSALEVFWGNNNQLTGSIPPLAGLSALQLFYVNNNQLSGFIPSLSGLTSLQAFYGGFNQLTGSIPSLSGLTALQFFRVETNQLIGSLPSLAGLSALQVFRVDNNQIGGAVVAVPAPTNALTNGFSALCPNQITVSADAAWNTAVGAPLWSTNCVAPRIAQSLSFGVAPLLVLGGTGTVAATSNPAPGSSAPILYSSNTPAVCSVNATSGLVTVLPAAIDGDVCAVAADKAGDASHNSAAQVLQSITIVTLINGACGAANSVATVSTPTIGLCSATSVAGSVATALYQFSWTCNGANGGTNASCVAPRAYTVTPSVSAGGNGTISPSVPQTVTAGGTLAFTITPNSGYSIVGLGGTCGGSLVGNIYTTNPVATGDCSVIISFAATPSALPVPTLNHWFALLLGALLFAFAMATRRITGRVRLK
jgi:Divergent InlB B-repeat domain